MRAYKSAFCPCCCSFSDWVMRLNHHQDNITAISTYHSHSDWFFLRNLIFIDNGCVVYVCLPLTTNFIIILFLFRLNHPFFHFPLFSYFLTFIDFKPFKLFAAFQIFAFVNRIIRALTKQCSVVTTFLRRWWGCGTLNHYLCVIFYIWQFCNFV